jgi:hypothetical protein
VIFAVLILAALLVSGFLIFAKGEANMDLVPQAKNIFFAVCSALLFGIGSFAKNTMPEEFDPIKFLMTLILSILIGFAMYYLHLDYSSAYSAVTAFLANTGALAAIEIWLKAIVRNYVKS